MARTVRLLWLIGILVAATASLHAWAGPYDPLDTYGGSPDKGYGRKAGPPPPPKPFLEKDGIRYYTLTEFRQDESNVKKIWRDKDDRGQVLALGGSKFDRGFFFLQKEGVENYVQWHIDGKYAQLEMVVGVPDDLPGQVTFYVYGDDRRIYRTEALDKEHRSEKISVPVDGIEHLSIRTHANQKAVGARLVVGDPVLTREPGM